jgi:molybdate transport system ATP-binding protein
MLAGLDRPVSGRVEVDGEVWLDTERGADAAPQRRRVGMVFQHYALFPHLDAGANVEAALGHLPRGQRAARVHELLAMVNLQGLERRRPAALSGGQQQRVALARALSRDPALLLLDEPFSAVDQVTRRKLRGELAGLRGRLHVPVVIVTHDLDEASMLADRICIIHRGATLQDGPPAEVFARPRNADVARLIDVVNLFEGRVVGQRPEVPCTDIAWGEQVLEASHAAELAPGDLVCWAIPPHAVLLHRRDRPSRGERENPIEGVIERFVPLGESASLTLVVAGEPPGRLSLSVPMHVADRNRLAEGGRARVSLLRESIHLMPWERL